MSNHDRYLSSRVCSTVISVIDYDRRPLQIVLARGHMSFFGTQDRVLSSFFILQGVHNNVRFLFAFMFPESASPWYCTNVKCSLSPCNVLYVSCESCFPTTYYRMATLPITACSSRRALIPACSDTIFRKVQLVEVSQE